MKVKHTLALVLTVALSACAQTTTNVRTGTNAVNWHIPEQAERVRIVKETQRGEAAARKQIAYATPQNPSVSPFRESAKLQEMRKQLDQLANQVVRQEDAKVQEQLFQDWLKLNQEIQSQYAAEWTQYAQYLQQLQQARRYAQQPQQQYSDPYAAERAFYAKHGRTLEQGRSNALLSAAFQAGYR